MAGMEFSYKLSEAEFLCANKLRNKGNPVFVIFKVIRGLILFWICVFVCFILVWVLVQRGASSPAVALQPTTGHVGAGHLLMALTIIFGPFALILGAVIFLLVGLEPMLARRSYRKDPSMQGQFTVNITPDSIHMQNTGGTSSNSAWNLYSYWRERKGVIILMFHSGAYSIVSLAGLSEPQRDELRSILSAALPKR
jgi:hypothetical protein